MSSPLQRCSRSLCHPCPVASVVAAAAIAPPVVPVPRCVFSTAHSPHRHPPSGPEVLEFAEHAPDLRRRFYRNDQLDAWANKKATLTTLRHLILFGRQVLADGRTRLTPARAGPGARVKKLLLSGNYIRRELPVRLAHRIRDLQGLPYAVMTHARMGDVYREYWSAFETLRKWPALTTLEQNDKFCQTVRRMIQRHGDLLLPALTQGIVQSSEAHALLAPDVMDRFMGRMLRSSISRRILAEQHLALSAAFHEPQQPPEPHRLPGELRGGNQIGIIATRLDIAEVIRRVMGQVRAELIEENPPYPVPDVVLDGDLGTKMAAIPEHVEWIVHQLVSNAMRSTMLRPPDKRDGVPIRLTVVEGQGDQDVLIRSSDSGGGLPLFMTPPEEPENWQLGIDDTLRPRHATVPYHPLTEGEASDLAHRGGGAFHAPEAQQHAKQATANSTLSLPLDDELGGRDFAFGDDAMPRLVRSRAGLISGSPRSVGSSGAEQDGLVRMFCSFSLIKTRKEWATAHALRTPAGQPGLAHQASKTGLGLPVTKVYCDFFGGSLALRSLDGHSTDVYVRLPKLGRTRRDAVEEIVL